MCAFKARVYAEQQPGYSQTITGMENIDFTSSRILLAEKGNQKGLIESN
jgi:hypothetical protein